MYDDRIFYDAGVFYDDEDDDYEEADVEVDNVKVAMIRFCLWGEWLVIERFR